MSGEDVAFLQWVSDMDRRTFNVDAMRQAAPALVEAEQTKRDLQTRLLREQLQSRVQEAQMWLDDTQLWVEEEQLRLDGAESSLMDALAQLEQKQHQVDAVEAEIEQAQSGLDQAQVCLGRNWSY